MYDSCVASRIFNEKQHAIRFHVDDILSNHVDPSVNDEFLKWLNDNYGGLKKVTATTGSIHKYLGMIIDFSKKGEVTFRMDNYVINIFSV